MKRLVSYVVLLFEFIINSLMSIAAFFSGIMIKVTNFYGKIAYRIKNCSKLRNSSKQQSSLQGFPPKLTQAEQDPRIAEWNLIKFRQVRKKGNCRIRTEKVLVMWKCETVAVPSVRIWGRRIFCQLYPPRLLCYSIESSLFQCTPENWRACAGTSSYFDIYDFLKIYWTTDSVDRKNTKPFSYPGSGSGSRRSHP